MISSAACSRWGNVLVRERAWRIFRAGRKQLFIHSCLVRIARPRLSRAGLMPPSVPGEYAEFELQLYDLLKRERRLNAYSRYNALIRELISFENALAQRRRTVESAK